MTVSRDFSFLNILRPLTARFGEVVSIDLHIDGESLGYAKRKSIHVPPSSNAYWNYMTLRSLVTADNSRKGRHRDDRIFLERAIHHAVSFIHSRECEATYDEQSDLLKIQYYDLQIDKGPTGWSIRVSDWAGTHVPGHDVSLIAWLEGRFLSTNGTYKEWDQRRS
jgi:hypothetical protein